MYCLLIFADKGLRVLAEFFLRPKILRYPQNCQWVRNFIFSKWKIYLNQFIDKFFKFEKMGYLIHYVKFKMWPPLRKFPIVISVVN